MGRFHRKQCRNGTMAAVTHSVLDHLVPRLIVFMKAEITSN